MRGTDSSSRAEALPGVGLGPWVSRPEFVRGASSFFLVSPKRLVVRPKRLGIPSSFLNITANSHRCLDFVGSCAAKAPPQPVKNRLHAQEARFM